MSGLTLHKMGKAKKVFEKLTRFGFERGGQFTDFKVVALEHYVRSYHNMQSGVDRPQDIFSNVRLSINETFGDGMTVGQTYIVRSRQEDTSSPRLLKDVIRQ